MKVNSMQISRLPQPNPLALSTLEIPKLAMRSEYRVLMLIALWETWSSLTHSVRTTDPAHAYECCKMRILTHAHISSTPRVCTLGLSFYWCMECAYKQVAVYYTGSGPCVSLTLLFLLPADRVPALWWFNYGAAKPSFMNWESYPLAPYELAGTACLMTFS